MTEKIYSAGKSDNKNEKMSDFRSKKGRNTDWHKKCGEEVDFLSDL